MKQLFTLALAFACLSAHSQSGQMPFNPDYDGDNVVATTDFLAVLPLFGSTMVDTSLTCDYQGTELETLFGGLIAGNLVLDSVYVEYLIFDSLLTYSPECPDPFMVETVLDRSFMMSNSNAFLQYANPWVYASGYYLGYDRDFKIQFYPENGSFRLLLSDFEVENFFPFNQISMWNGDGSQYVSLPFPENWSINEDGIQVGWSGWVANCEHFRLIPYWHEAE